MVWNVLGLQALLSTWVAALVTWWKIAGHGDRTPGSHPGSDSYWPMTLGKSSNSSELCFDYCDTRPAPTLMNCCAVQLNVKRTREAGSVPMPFWPACFFCTKESGSWDFWGYFPEEQSHGDMVNKTNRNWLMTLLKSVIPEAAHSTVYRSRVGGIS